MRTRLSVKDLEEGLKKGDRAFLSRAITLIESALPEDQELARDLIEKMMPLTGHSVRIGITGVPGAGKSTLIEALGKRFTSSGKKVAVLAVDPTSQVSGGSILGDKTRMEELSRDPNAYIRPSPTGFTSGGIAEKTRESALLCEAAGFDVILIETVGVGQTEIKVKGMTDVFILVLLTGAGDELQMIKKGIMEMADLIVINKADGANIKSAESLRKEIEMNLPYPQHPESGWKTPVLTASALEGKGIDELVKSIHDFVDFTSRKNFFQENRRRQSGQWLRETIGHLLEEEFYKSPEIKKAFELLKKEVSEGKISASGAALKLIHIFKSSR